MKFRDVYIGIPLPSQQQEGEVESYMHYFLSSRKFPRSPLWLASGTKERIRAKKFEA